MRKFFFGCFVVFVTIALLGAVENGRLITDGNTDNIPKFGGTIYYVDGTNGNNDNTGTSPTDALSTIGEAIGRCVKGDAISIFAATYTEVGLDLNVDAVELWVEIGTIIAPASGTGLLISANYCKIKCPGGSLRINSTGAVGLQITGTFNYVDGLERGNYEK